MPAIDSLFNRKSRRSMLSRSNRGVTAIEYALIALLVGSAIVGVVISVGSNDKSIYCTVASALDAGGACSVGTPGAGELPFPGMSPLPAGTVCSTQSDGYPTSSNGTLGYVRTCTTPGGSLYSASFISVNPATGAVSAQLFNAPGMSVVPNPSGSGQLIDMPSGGFFGPGAPAPVVTPYNTLGGFGLFNQTQGYTYDNGAFAASEGNTLAAMAAQNASTGGTNTTSGAESAATDYALGINQGDVIPNQSAGAGYFGYSPQP